MDTFGFGELTKRLEADTREIIETMEDAMFDCMNDVQQKSQDLAPLDTGDLRANMYTEKVRELEIITANDLPYALKQHEELEYHHENGQAKYLEQPFRERRQKHLNYISKKIKQFLKR